MCPLYPKLVHTLKVCHQTLTLASKFVKQSAEFAAAKRANKTVVPKFAKFCWLNPKRLQTPANFFPK